jgi:hypothetical protein
MTKSSYNGNGNSFANGMALPSWARNWEFQVCVWEPRTTHWDFP